MSLFDVALQVGIAVFLIRKQTITKTRSALSGDQKNKQINAQQELEAGY